MTQRLEEGRRGGPRQLKRGWKGGWGCEEGAAGVMLQCFCTSLGLVPMRAQGAWGDAQC